jgi:hypothetical protein
MIGLLKHYDATKFACAEFSPAHGTDVHEHQ